MSDYAFVADVNPGTGEPSTIYFATSGTATFVEIKGPDIMISVRSNGIYYRWGRSEMAAVTSTTAATVGHWLPAGSVLRLGKPDGANGISVLQDTGAAQVYITPGRGI